MTTDYLKLAEELDAQIKDRSFSQAAFTNNRTLLDQAAQAIRELAARVAEITKELRKTNTGVERNSKVMGLIVDKNIALTARNEKLVETIKDAITLLSRSNDAFLSDVRQPTKLASGFVDTIYHLDGQLCGSALNKNRDFIALHSAALKDEESK